MSGGIFVLRDAATLVAMKPAMFASEDDFQRLLAQFPALLGGAQRDGETPIRWLLLGREKGIQSEDSASGRWAADHLFLDQDGVPTFVEVKRQGDTRLRREVIGQMLDYAANAVMYWSWERLREQFTSDCAKTGTDAETVIAEQLGEDVDSNRLWENVKTNLQAGKVRLLFVADLIPPEVKRIVEFLNKQMDPAEVLAIELRQFEGEGLKTIVPSVFGRTEEAQQRKSVSGPTRQWDEVSILEELSKHVEPVLIATAIRITERIKAKSDEVIFGRGDKDGSIGAAFRNRGTRFVALQLWTSGVAGLNFGYMNKPPYDDFDIRRGWVDRMRAIPGVNLPSDAENRYPNIRLPVLAANLDAFLAAMDWLANGLRPNST
jgi:hypothetical protein